MVSNNDTFKSLTALTSGAISYIIDQIKVVISFPVSCVLQHNTLVSNYAKRQVTSGKLTCREDILSVNS